MHLVFDDESFGKQFSRVEKTRLIKVEPYMERVYCRLPVASAMQRARSIHVLVTR